MNAVVGINDIEQARQFLLERGIEAFRKQAGYIPQVELPEFTTPFFDWCWKREHLNEENVRNNPRIAIVLAEVWMVRYAGDCPDWERTWQIVQILIDLCWERYDELMALEGIGWPLIRMKSSFGYCKPMI